MTTLLEALKNKQKEMAAKRTRAKTDKLPSGKSQWRILPHWSGDGTKSPFHDWGAHFVKDAQGKLQAVYICVEKTFGKPCEICTQVGDALAVTTDPDLKERIYEAKAAQHYLLNAVRKTGANYANEVSLLEVSGPVFEQITNLAVQYMEENQVDIFSMSEGVDLTITREGSGKQTRYSVLPAMKTTKIDPSLLSKAHNLDDYVSQEFEEGRQKALASLRGVVGGSSPTLTAPAALPREVIDATPIGSRTAAVASKTAEDALTEVDLDELNLDDLDDAAA